jgi:broad specificity phosphatase PhoE
MIVTHIRHAPREEGNKHITNKGLNVAQQVGKLLSNFDMVFTSVSVRAIETCIAMGYTIDDSIDFSICTKGINKPLKELLEGTPFTEYQKEYLAKTSIFDFGNNCKQAIIDKINEFQVNKDINILIVSHGGVIESSTVAFNPNEDFSLFGRGVSHCEGVILELTDSFSWVAGRPFRHTFS